MNNLYKYTTLGLVLASMILTYGYCKQKKQVSDLLSVKVENEVVINGLKNQVNNLDSLKSNITQTLNLKDSLYNKILVDNQNSKFKYENKIQYLEKLNKSKPLIIYKDSLSNEEINDIVNTQEEIINVQKIRIEEQDSLITQTTRLTEDLTLSLVSTKDKISDLIDKTNLLSKQYLDEQLQNEIIHNQEKLALKKEIQKNKRKNFFQKATLLTTTIAGVVLYIIK